MVVTIYAELENVALGVTRCPFEDKCCDVTCKVMLAYNSKTHVCKCAHPANYND